MTGFYMKCNNAQKCSITVSNNKIIRKCLKMWWHHLESFLPGTIFFFCHKVVKISEGNVSTLTAFIVGIKFVTTLFYEVPPTYYLARLFQLLSTPPSLAPTSTPTALFVALFLWLNVRVYHTLCYFPNWYDGSIHLCRALVPY